MPGKPSSARTQRQPKPCAVCLDARRERTRPLRCSGNGGGPPSPPGRRLSGRAALDALASVDIREPSVNPHTCNIVLDNTLNMLYCSGMHNNSYARFIYLFCMSAAGKPETQTGANGAHSRCNPFHRNAPSRWHLSPSGGHADRRDRRPSAQCDGAHERARARSAAVAAKASHTTTAA